MKAPMAAPMDSGDTGRAMSQENLALARHAFEAWIRGDLDTLFKTYDPAIEWDNTRWEGWPEEQVYYGHEGVRRLFHEWLSSWERFEAGADDYLDIGGDQVLLLVWQRGLGPGSQVPVHMDWALLATLKGGLVRRVQAYSDQARGPRSRGAAGVGDVAGERGVRASQLRRVEHRRYGRLS